MEKNKVIVV